MKYEIYELEVTKQTGNMIQEVSKKHILDMFASEESRFELMDFNDILKNYKDGYYLYIVGFKNDKPVLAKGVIYKVNGSWWYDIPEHDDRVEISVAFDKDLM